MDIKKYKMVDILLSILISITGIVGFIIIPTIQIPNLFLIIYILLNLCLLPIYFCCLMNNKLCFCIFIPIVFLFGLIDSFYWFNLQNNLVGFLILICTAIALIFSTCTTIFIHSHKPIQDNENDSLLNTSNILFRRKVLKRVWLYVRDVIVAFVISIGIVFYSNIAFDSSNIVEFEVIVVDMNEREWKFDRSLYVEYRGSDSNVSVNNIRVPNHFADNVSKGDKLLLKYRKGFLYDSYFWISDYDV